MVVRRQDCAHDRWLYQLILEFHSDEFHQVAKRRPTSITPRKSQIPALAGVVRLFGKVREVDGEDVSEFFT